VSSNGRVQAAIAIAAGLTPLNSTMIAVALPAISSDFSAPASRVTMWVVTAYLVATILCQVPAGRLADRLGYQRTLALGRWMFAAGAAAALLAPSLWFLVAGRLLMAAGGALMVPTAMALLRVAVPEERRPRAFGAMGAVMAGAAALGPALGGLLIARASWRVLFLVNLPLILLSWTLQPADMPTAAPSRRGGSTEGWGSALASLFRRRAFVAGASVVALQNLAMYSLLIQVPFLFSPGESGLGLAIMAMTLTMAVTAPIGGRLAERVGSASMVIVGGLVGTAGIIWLTRLPAHAGVAALGSRLLLVGLGVGLSTGPAQASALSAVEAHRSGLASATISTFRYLGAVAGTAILGLTLAGSAGAATQQQLALWLFAAAFALSAISGVGLVRSR
jgi:MFS family permease